MNRRVFLSGVVAKLVAGCVSDPADSIDSPPGTDVPSGTDPPAGTGSPTETRSSTATESSGSSEPSSDGGIALKLDEAVPETITLDDVVERAVSVENRGDERGTVMVTLTAVHATGMWFLDDPGGHETVTVDPGQSQAVTLSWSPDAEALDGEYDLLIEIWNETTLDDRSLLLDEHTEDHAVTVEKPTGTLSVTTTPSDAMVTVAREVQGTTLPGELVVEMPVELPVGPYEVAVVHSEYDVVTESVTVEEDETTSVEIELTEDDQ